MKKPSEFSRLIKAGVATGAMLAIGWFATPRLSHWYSERMADRLMSQISATDDSAVKIPLRQLASLGEPALDSLVVAAASDRAAVATIAQQILDEQLSRWLLLLESQGDSSNNQQAATAFSTFSSALASNIELFGPVGMQWAEQWTLKMIDVANRLPGQQAQTVLDSCSQILAAVPARGPRIRTVQANVDPLPPLINRQLQSPQPSIESLTRASDSSLDILARIPSGSDLEFQSPSSNLPKPFEEIPKTASLPTELQWSAQEKPTPTAQSPVAEQDTAPTESVETAKPLPKRKSRLVDVPSPLELANQEAALARLDTKTLLTRLQNSGTFETGAIQRVLAKRGYSKTEVKLVQRSYSVEVSERLQLVEDASFLSAAASQRFLRRLLTDKEGDVRLKALTALATSKTSDLTELARNLAVYDDDPRVAELASRLLRPTR